MKIAEHQGDEGIARPSSATGTIAVSSQTGSGIRTGETVHVVTSGGAKQDLQVVAVLDTTIDAADVGNLVEPATFDALVGQTAPTAAFIDASRRRRVRHAGRDRQRGGPSDPTSR